MLSTTDEMMKDPRDANRRTVLKTIGAGVVGGTVLTGSATAKGNNCGNGNGIGAFLNEEAVFKNRPVWDSGVADKTGESEVEVSVGTMTSVDIPEEMYPGGDPPEEGPFGYDPRAVKVSPGTEVTWAWVTGHHSVTSYNASADSPDEHGQEFESHSENPGHTFSHTFDEVGTYLYFCHPHGTPYPIPFGPLGEVPNHTGMRGAVKVVDD